ELAKSIVKTYYGAESAVQAQTNFLQIFQKGGIPEDIPEIQIPVTNMSVWELVNTTQLLSTNSEGKRMIQQGSVKINQEKKTDPQEIIKLESGMIIQIGKRLWVKIA
nr:S4 domain-containing protein [Candidatus Gracilibacteria bacterium]